MAQTSERLLLNENFALFIGEKKGLMATRSTLGHGNMETSPVSDHEIDRAATTTGRQVVR